jgi:hypothetical protein
LVLPGVDGAVGGGPEDRDFAAAVASLTQRLLGTPGALDDRLPFDERLIFPIQESHASIVIGPMDAERPFSQLWESNAAYFSSGIRIQLERPYNAIARGGIVRCWLETPVA